MPASKLSIKVLRNDTIVVKSLKNEAKDFKVRDYDHIKRWFIGAVYCQCNSERPVNLKISIFIKKFCKYDAHFIVQEIKNGLTAK